MIDSLTCVLGRSIDFAADAVGHLFNYPDYFVSTVGDRRFLIYRTIGLEVKFGVDDKVSSIFIKPHSPIALGWVSRADAVKRSDLLELLGVPFESCGPQELEIIGVVGAWDRWKHGRNFVHAQYRVGSDILELLTLSAR